MIGALRPYAEYKDSGLPWLPTIPAHWQTVRNGSLFAQRSETGYSDLPILEVSLQTGVRVRALGSAGRKQVMSDLAKYKRATKGDLAYNTMRMWQGAAGTCPVDGLVSPAYVVASPRTGTDSAYFAALFRTSGYLAEIDSASRGIVKDRNRLYWEQFKQMRSPCPPPAEQAAIVRFLDWANGRLERAIRAKRKVIALLTEQKQVIIRRVLTRGQRSSVTLRPSGIAWLGDIPQHWEVRRLKSVLRLQRGYDLPSDRRRAGEIPVYSSGGHIDNHDTAMAEPPGIVVGRYGSTNAVFFVEEPYWPHNTALFTTTLYDNDARWCYYVLRSIPKDEYAGKSAVPGVDRKDLFDIRVPRPPLAEQRAMALEIGRHLYQFDQTTESTEREVRLIREYRTRLFSEVVTGKLDVRDAAARLPEESRGDISEKGIDEGDGVEHVDEGAAA